MKDFRSCPERAGSRIVLPCSSLLLLCLVFFTCVGCNDLKTKGPEFQLLDEAHPLKSYSKDVAYALLAGKVSEDRITKAEYLRQPSGPFGSSVYWSPGYPKTVVAAGDVHSLLTTVSQSSKKLPYDPNCPEFDADNIHHLGSLFVSVENGATGCLKIYDVFNSDYYLFGPAGLHPGIWHLRSPFRFVAKSKVPITIWNQKATVNADIPLLFPDLTDEQANAIGEKKFENLYKQARQFVDDSRMVKKYLGDLQRIRPSVRPNHRVVSPWSETGFFTFWVQGEVAEGLVTVQVPGPNDPLKVRIRGRLLITKSESDVPGMVNIDLDRIE